MLASLDDSVVICIDLQPTFLKVISEAERVVQRSRFLVECANTLGVPVIVTEQNPDKMGGTDPRIDVKGVVVGKMEFGCWGNHDFRSSVLLSVRRQIVIVGIETHICVAQTALEMLEAGFDVSVAVDAISSRHECQSKVGIKRLRDAGVVITHTESVVYEWLRTAAHPKFKEILPIVKELA